MDQAGTGFKIRRRERLNSSPPEGLRQTWTEYQIVSGRGKICARRDTLAQAIRDFPGAELDSSINRQQ